MRIINVGNFEYKNRFQSFFNTARKLSHGLIRLGHSVYDFSDRDVSRQFGLFNSRKLGVRSANACLLDACRNVEPDLVLLGHADVIQPDTLAAIRKALPAVRIAQWNYDALYLADNIRRLESKIDVVDITFVSTAGPAPARLSRPGGRVAYLPNPVDSSMEDGRSFEVADHEHDLFFGMRSGRNWRRWGDEPLTGDALAKRLRAAFPDFRLCLPGLEERPPVYGMAYLNSIRNSLMGLSLSQESNQPLYASDRMAHLTGMGTLTLIDRSTGFDRIYAEDEAAFYSSVDELIEKARHFKNHPDEARLVAERGWRRTHAVFDSRRVARYLIEQTFGMPFTEGYEWPVEAL